MTHIPCYRKFKKSPLRERVIISVEGRMSLRCLWTSSGDVHQALRYFCLVQRKELHWAMWLGAITSDVRPKSMGGFAHGKMHALGMGEGRVQDTEEQKKNQECSRD